MKKLSKNWLFLNRIRIIFILLLVLPKLYLGQTTNFINNGGFEDAILGNPPAAKYWSSLDSIKFSGELLSKSLAPFLVPWSGYTYQWPRHGNNFLATTWFCSTCSYNTRGYPRNRLKFNLEQGKTYCFSMYLNLTNKSAYAISSIGVFFANLSVDTINYCTNPLTYLTPQIQNLPGNHISDTLNWVLVNGLYTADGTEKYVLIGNFNYDQNSDTSFVNPTFLPQKFAAYCIDDVSLIERDLPAFAGRDTAVLPGSSVFLGRESDVGIDEACIWYKLPNSTNPIDTIAGFAINPITTSTYVVRQQLTCSSTPKWDTVVVTVDPTVGNFELNPDSYQELNTEFELFPNPANDVLELKLKNLGLNSQFNKLLIYNNLGQLMKEQTWTSAKIEIGDLNDGVYFVEVKSSEGLTRKRFVINR